MEVVRISTQTGYLRAYSEAIRSVFGILNTCLDNMVTATGAVNPVWLGSIKKSEALDWKAT